MQMMADGQAAEHVESDGGADGDEDGHEIPDPWAPGVRLRHVGSVKLAMPIEKMRCKTVAPSPQMLDKLWTEWQTLGDTDKVRSMVTLATEWPRAWCELREKMHRVHKTMRKTEADRNRREEKKRRLQLQNDAQVPV